MKRLTWPLGLTALLLATGWLAASPLVNSESLLPPADATLHLPGSYIFFAPWCTALDALSVLSLRQHIAMFLVVWLCYVIWRIMRQLAHTHRPTLVRIWRELRASVILLFIVACIYAIGILAPRPMAQLRLHDPSLIAVDFHSHTDASWDGRHGFDAEANRQWHRDAGFHAAYITDHASIAGVRKGLAKNPARAGDGTTLLLGLEARDADEHILAIDIDTTRDIDPTGQWHDPHLSALLTRSLNAPLLILSIPGNVTSIPYTEQRGNSPLYAVELSDASPKGIDQVHRDRERILQLADSLQLALVAGSDLHGWGRTAAAWSVLRIPGWRAVTPAELAIAICNTIRTQRRHAVQVIERRAPDPDGSWLQLLFTPVSVLWVLLRTLSWPERLSWVVWIWTVALAINLKRRTFLRHAHLTR